MPHPMSRSPGHADDVLAHVGSGADVVVAIANGEPVGLLDALEANAGRLRNVRIHQMHALHERRYIWGELGDHLRHVSYFLSHVTRKPFLEGKCELVPNHFSEVPMILERSTKLSLVLAAASPMDRHGYFSLGTNADYVAPFIGRAPFFLEVNARMPRTFGHNQIHVSQVAGWTESDYPLVEVPPVQPNDKDLRIAAFICDRIPDGATIQTGIGAIPSAVLAGLHGHRDLGIHTELFSDAIIDLFERGIANGVRKKVHPGKMVTTFALGTNTLYDFLHENTGVELLPVDYVNNPLTIAREDCFVSINATTEVDLLGQCASETIGGRYWSSSGGQSDFARGAINSPHGKAFIVLHSTTTDESLSRIRTTLTPGSVVTTLKNTVDHIVTEYGVAELRGRSISERARALIRIAHPKFRDALDAEARSVGYLHD
ncbi:MAG TPA: acetyl-CoA hydrolase/transferase C-terminal domain-containing protein [Acidimicrobiales bacterium]|nr:acetyl-CoA hydrolase/transferase C-terminal domain-containing protein [Acidimicrobiales bacterium]